MDNHRSRQILNYAAASFGILNMATTSPTGQDVEPSAYALCNLLLLVPHLPLTTTSELDYTAADPALLVQLADAADATLLIIHIGTSAIGRLLARTATEPFGEEAIADAVEVLGWLVAELGDLAGAVHKISAACRLHTHDYAPDAVTTIPLARP